MTTLELNVLIAEQKEQIRLLVEAKKQLEVANKELAEKAKLESQEQAKIKAEARSARIAELLNVEPKVNKTQEVKILLLQGLDNKAIAEATGYSAKFILDTVWRIEKSLGLR